MSAQVAEARKWHNAGEFRAAVRAWAERIKVKPRRIQIQEMAKKWASCSPAGTVSFSRDLLNMDREFGEAVIVHELVHLRVPNHGKLFRSLVSSFTDGRLAEVSEDRSVDMRQGDAEDQWPSG
ncbi:MAG: metal-dependent hydrolase [Pseudonocardiales bacterium]|nr:MAG: metal-dependent hydrolase [Pseudonocardiales bacterium]